MRSKVSSRILSKTKEEVRQQVRDYTDMIVELDRMIKLHESSDNKFMSEQYISIRDNQERKMKKLSLCIDNPYHRFKGSRYFYLWAYCARRREKASIRKIFDIQEVLNRLHDFK